MREGGARAHALCTPSLPLILHPYMGISNLTDKRVKNVKESAVSDHPLQCDCTIDFNHFDILTSDTNNFRLIIKESLLIKRDQPVLNCTVKSFSLKLFD